LDLLGNAGDGRSRDRKEAGRMKMQGVAGKEGAAKTKKEAREWEEKGRMGTPVGWGGRSKERGE